jgi:hypothetical protein
MGIFADFLRDKKIPEAQLIGVSNELERLRPEDRELLLKRQAARTAEKKYDEEKIGKPRRGRGVTTQSIARALADQPLARKVRSKLLVAVNTVLERRKQEKVRTEQLFGKVGVAKRSPKKVTKKK